MKANRDNYPFHKGEEFEMLNYDFLTTATSPGKKQLPTWVGPVVIGVLFGGAFLCMFWGK